MKAEKQIRLCTTFYISTLSLNLPVSVLLGSALMANGQPFTFTSFINIILIMHTTVGLLIALIYKELARKEEYHFYFNGSLSKPILIGATFLISLLPLLIFRIITTICNIPLK